MLEALNVDLVRRSYAIASPAMTADNGDVTFQVSDRGAELGVLAESIPNLVAADYVIPQLEGEGTEILPGWKLKALIKAATDAAIGASLHSATSES